MTTQDNKYPNADTSPERLAQIKADWVRTGQLYDSQFRDLLDMLQERDAQLAHFANQWKWWRLIPPLPTEK